MDPKALMVSSRRRGGSSRVSRPILSRATCSRSKTGEGVRVWSFPLSPRDATHALCSMVCVACEMDISLR